MHRTISHLPTVQRAETESVLNIYKKPSKDYKSKSVTIQMPTITQLLLGKVQIGTSACSIEK